MMSDKWERVRLGDYIKVKHGFAFKGEFIDTKINNNILVTPGNFNIGGGFKSDKFKYYFGEIPKEYILKPNDVIVTMTDLSKAGDTLGYSALVPNNDKKLYLHNQRIGLIQFKNENIYKLFLYWRLRNYDYQKSIVASATGTTVKHTSPTKIENFVLNLPPLETQEKIANILSSLDDKIENNKKTAEKLEEISQTLFNRWFVEFNFPDENGLPYKDNGGEMVESELGLVPKGWEVRSLEDISYIQNGYAFKSSDYVDFGCNMIRTTNIEDSGFVNNNDLINLPFEFLDSDKYRQFNFENLDTVLVMVGASIGKIGLITEINIPSLQNQNMWRFRSKDINISNVYIHYTVKLLNNKFQNWSNWSARQFFRKSVFSEAKILKSSEIILQNFSTIIEPKFNYLSKLQLEIEQLKNLRENLLPKLMSGEIEV